MSELTPISILDDHTGLVWHEMATPQYLVELQTGVIPMLLHLAIFDVTANHKLVHEQLTAYSIGDTLNSENMDRLDSAISEALANL